MSLLLVPWSTSVSFMHKAGATAHRGKPRHNSQTTIHIHHRPLSSKMLEGICHQPLIAPAFEGGRDKTLMPHHGRENGTLTQGRLLAVACISSGSLAEPQDSLCLFLDIFNFRLPPFVEAPSLTGKYAASSLLPLATQHRKHGGTGMTLADVVCSTHGRQDRE